MVIEVEVKEAPFLKDKQIDLVINGKPKRFTILAYYSEKEGTVIYHIPPSFPREALKVIFGSSFRKRNSRNRRRWK